MTIEKLIGTALDAEVLRALGLDVMAYGDLAYGTMDTVPVAVVGDPSLSPFLRSPSRDWLLGGTLIQQHNVGIARRDRDTWLAECRGKTATGATPLVAAMRALCLGMRDLPPIDLERLRECSLPQLLARFREGFLHDRQSQSGTS
jgi:hypothetical protein